MLHQITINGNMTYNVWQWNPKLVRSATGSWEFKAMIWASSEIKAIEIAKMRFGLSFKYQAYEAL